MNGVHLAIMYERGTLDRYLDLFKDRPDLVMEIVEKSLDIGMHTQDMENFSDVMMYLETIEFPDVDRSLYADLGLVEDIN